MSDPTHDFACWFAREFNVSCLGVKPSDATIEARLAAVRAQRTSLHEACKVSKQDPTWTHEHEGNRLRFTPEQAFVENSLYCTEYLLSNGDADPVLCAPENTALRKQRIDEAVTSFLHCGKVAREDGARVSHADFADALRREMKLKNVSQHAISQACKRAGLVGLASHTARFWTGIKLS